MEIQTKTIDNLYEKYHPVKNWINTNAAENGYAWETYGAEYEEVKKILAENPKRVLTITDNGDGWYGVISGWHYINRISYILLPNGEEWQDENEEYTIYDNSELREQWERLPMEAIIEIADIQEENIADMEPEDIRDEYLYVWEELCELERDEIMEKYKR